MKTLSIIIAATCGWFIDRVVYNTDSIETMFACGAIAIVINLLIDLKKVRKM